MFIPFKEEIGRIRNQLVPETKAYPSVLWLSHHVPKTAGSSLLHAYVEAFGRENISNAYRSYYTARRLSHGKNVWVRKDAVVVHGHFRPHQNQLRYFPNAQRIIWLRDPLDRSMSLLRHIEQKVTFRPVFQQFKDESLLPGAELEDKLDALLRSKSLHDVVRIYSRYLDGVRPEEFAFIGRTEQFNDDLSVLSSIMHVTLTPQTVNQTTKGKGSIDRGRFEHLLSDEYDVYNRWIEYAGQINSK